MRARRAVPWVLGIAALVAVIPAIVVLVATTRVTAPWRDVPPPEIARSTEVFDLRVGDRTVDAWWVHGAQPSRGTVVVLHGYAHAKTQVVPHILWARDAGYDVLAVSVVAHGASDGWRHDVGRAALADARAAITEARRRSPGRPLFALGFSMGAGLLLSLGADVGVDAIVALAPYRDLERAADVRIRRFLPDPVASLLLAGVNGWAAWIVGVRPSEIAPARAMRSLPPSLPVLFVVGADDWKAPPEDVRAMAAARATEPYIVPGAGHDDLWEVGGAALRARVAAFFTAASAPP